jgi:hypothetical protein
MVRLIRSFTGVLSCSTNPEGKLAAGVWVVVGVVETTFNCAVEEETNEAIIPNVARRRANIDFLRTIYREDLPGGLASSGGEIVSLRLKEHYVRN